MNFLSEDERFKFLHTLSIVSKIQILTGIFFTIGALGFLIDIFETPEMPPLWITLLRVFTFGGFAIISILISIKNKKLSLIIIPFFIISLSVISHINFQPITGKMVQNRVITDALAAFISIIIGYSLFIRFISKEGHKKLKLQVEINLAQEMHKILVPPISLNYENIEVEGLSLPYSEVGGDLIDVIHTEQNTTCIIADVSGHGVSAGLLMGTFKSAVRILLQKDIALEELLNRINKVLFDLKKKNMFITVAIIRIEKGNKAIYSIAGHLPILHLHQCSGNIEKLGMKQIGLGIRSSYKFHTETITFEKEDLFILQTDGLPEVQNKDGIMLGDSIIEDIIKKKSNQLLKNIKKSIFDAANLHGKSHDDQTILLLRCL